MEAAVVAAVEDAVGPATEEAEEAAASAFEEATAHAVGRMEAATQNTEVAAQHMHKATGGCATCGAGSRGRAPGSAHVRGM